MAQDIIDMVMGFDPAEALNGSAFSNETTGNFNQNIYKTNPAGKGVVLASEDGHYHAKVRVLMNPHDFNRNIVHQAKYSMTDERGYFSAISSLSNGDKNCPIFNGFKRLRYARIPGPDGTLIEDTEKVNWAKEHFDKTESDWVLVQIIEDENYPDLVGQFKAMKLPKAIMNRLQAKMKPTDPTKPKQPLMDYLFGPVLELDVVPGPDDPTNPGRRSREVNYDLCDFATDPTLIINVDGTPFFSDEEIELIEEYNNYNNDFNKANSDMLKAKTEGLKTKAEAKRTEAENKKAALRDQIRPLYGKAIEYVKANTINIVEECGYTPWSVDLTIRVNNWLDKVLAMQDPAVQTINENGSAAKQEDAGKPQLAATVASAPAVTAPFSAEAPAGDDLPF